MLTKKDMINARSAESLKNHKGEKLTVLDTGVTERVDTETGEKLTVGIIKTAEHGMLTTVSSTVIDCLEDLDEVIVEANESGEDVSIVVNARTANSGREYLVLEIL